MRTWLSLRMRSARTHAFSALKWAMVQMHHRNVSFKAVLKSEAAITIGAFVISFPHMSSTVMFLGGCPICEGLFASVASIDQWVVGVSYGAIKFFFFAGAKAAVLEDRSFLDWGSLHRRDGGPRVNHDLSR